MFNPDADQKRQIREIAEKMRTDVPTNLIKRARKLAEESEGVFNLFQLWDEARSSHDRKETIKAIEDCLKDYGR